MGNKKLNLVEIAYATEVEAVKWAKENEGGFAYGDNGGVVQTFTAHFHEEGKESNPKDVGVVISMCDAVCENEIGLIITDIEEIERLKDYFCDFVEKYKKYKVVKQ